MIIHNVAQGSQEWINLRAGRFTATEASTLKTAGKGLETIALEKAVWWLTGEPAERNFETPAMLWGKEWEPVAAEEYQKTVWQEVQTVGFCELDEYAGCSPDRLVGDDGLCEIKCKQPKNHLQTVLSGKIDSAHYGQMQFQLLVTGRKWCDYVCFCPFFKEKLFVKRVFPDKEYQEAILEGLKKGKELIQQYIKQYQEAYK